MRTILYLVISGLILTSCSQKFSLQKRKYTKGFYFASAKNGNTAKTKTDLKSETVSTNTVKEEVFEEQAEKTLVKETTTKEVASVNEKDKKQVTQKPDRKFVNIPEHLTKQPKSFGRFENTTNRKNIQSEINQKKKGGILDFLFDAYIGYLVITIIIGLVLLIAYLATIYSVTQIVLGIIVAIVILALLAGIGSVFTGR